MDSLPNPAFQPLSSEEIAAAEANQPSTKSHYWAISPKPADAMPISEYRHRDFGKPSMLWPYHNAQGEVIGYAARFDVANDDGTTCKEVLPISFCTNEKGQRFWAAKGFDDPRPPYRLQELLARPSAPVLLVEGEKATDAAVEFFPEMVVTTSPGGGKAVHKTDWSFANGRSVVIWPDNDDPGEAYARKAGQAMLDSGALSVSVVDVPDIFPEGWDLADDPPDGADLNKLLSEAQPIGEAPRYVSFGGFVMDHVGLRSVTDGNETFVSGPLEVLAKTRSDRGDGWGLLLRWKDDDGRIHQWAMPVELLAGNGDQIRQALLDQGLRLAPGLGARKHFLDYLASVRTNDRAYSVRRTGWHKGAFVLPDETIGDRPNERVILQTSGHIDHAYYQSGTLEQWQAEIAAPSAGNSRLVLAICAGLAGPLLEVVGDESGLFHFRGGSSIGKSTTLIVGGSVWGGGGANGYIKTWRATDNGLEGVAAAHNGTLLCLDELSQIAPQAAGAAAYMLANGCGKSRAGRSGEHRAVQTWCVQGISSGELSLADKMSEDGKARKVAAGQQVRVIDIPADAGKGLGLFQVLPAGVSAEQFARHLKASAGRFYGTCARAFIHAIIDDLPNRRDQVKTFKANFVQKHCPTDADGQVTRVLDRFALAAAAGELGTKLGILPWELGEATNAAVACFQAWLSERGSAGPSEVMDGIEQVKDHLFRYGQTRYQALGESSLGYDANESSARDIKVEQYGFRKDVGEKTHFIIPPSIWRDTVCRGYSARAISKALADKGFLIRSSDGKLQVPHRLPRMSRTRCYEVTSDIFDDDAGEGVHF